MSTALWVLQAVLAVKFLSTAWTHGLRHNQERMALAIQRMGRPARPLLRGVAALTLVDLAGGPLDATTRALLTLVGRAENRGMGWNEDRTSVGDRWGTGPVEAEGVPCAVEMRTRRPVSVWALDGRGMRRERVPSTWKAGTLRFRASPAHRTVWYEIADR